MVRAKDMVLCCDHLTHLFTFNYILDIMSSGATAVMTPPLPHFDKITQAIAEHKVQEVPFFMPILNVILCNSETFVSCDSLAGRSKRRYFS